MTNTMRNVTIVVPVLITSCQVSLNPKMGPVTPHTSTTPTAAAKALGRPAAREDQRAKRVNQVAFFFPMSTGARHATFEGPERKRIEVRLVPRRRLPALDAEAAAAAPRG